MEIAAPVHAVGVFPAAADEPAQMAREHGAAALTAPLPDPHGALGRDALSALGPSGAALGSLHPLQSLSDPATAPQRLSGAVAAVEAAGGAKGGREGGGLPLPRAARGLDVVVAVEEHGGRAVRADGKFLFISGQLAWGDDGKIIKGDMLAQTQRALKNLENVLSYVGGDLSNVVLTRWFVKSIDDFYKNGASTYRRTAFKKNFPTSTLVEIKRLAEEDALVL